MRGLKCSFTVSVKDHRNTVTASSRIPCSLYGFCRLLSSGRQWHWKRDIIFSFLFFFSFPYFFQFISSSSEQNRGKKNPSTALPTAQNSVFLGLPFGVSPTTRFTVYSNVLALHYFPSLSDLRTALRIFLRLRRGKLRCH